jgi:hypothetical protein
LDEIAISPIAERNELRRVLRPPHDHTSGERSIIGETDDDLGDLFD